MPEKCWKGDFNHNLLCKHLSHSTGYKIKECTINSKSVHDATLHDC